MKFDGVFYKAVSSGQAWEVTPAATYRWASGTKEARSFTPGEIPKVYTSTHEQRGRMALPPITAG